VSDRPLALERCSSRAIPKLAAWPDTGWNCLLIIRDRQAGVRCRKAASASDVGQGAPVDWQLRGKDSLFLSNIRGLLLRRTPAEL